MEPWSHVARRGGGTGGEPGEPEGEPDGAGVEAQVVHGVVVGCSGVGSCGDRLSFGILVIFLVRVFCSVAVCYRSNWNSDLVEVC